MFMSFQYSFKKLENGLSVASVDSASPVSRVAVVAAAGSRNECQDGLGLSHLLRSASTSVSICCVNRF